MTRQVRIIGIVAAAWTLAIYPLILMGLYFAGLPVDAVRAFLTYLPSVLGISGLAGWLFRRRNAK